MDQKTNQIRSMNLSMDQIHGWSDPWIRSYGLCPYRSYRVPVPVWIPYMEQNLWIRSRSRSMDQIHGFDLWVSPWIRSSDPWTRSDQIMIRPIHGLHGRGLGSWISSKRCNLWIRWSDIRVNFSNCFLLSSTSLGKQNESWEHWGEWKERARGGEVHIKGKMEIENP